MGAEQPCQHHWLIEPANGSVSQGRCIKCNATREFCNSFVTPDFREMRHQDGYFEQQVARADTGWTGGWKVA